MRSRLLFFLLGFGAFLVFVFFSYLVHKDLFGRIDFDTTVRLQDNISRRFDDAFSAFSDFGKFEPMILILVVLLVLRRKLGGIIAFGLFGFLHILELFGKFFVNHPPPPEFMLRTKQLIEFPQFHVRAEFSYPSGHAARAAFLTAIVSLMVARSKKLSSMQKAIIISILIAYDTVMFASRVYLGEHWISDVAGGGLLGLSLGLLAAIII